jgi:DNA polymerase III gamma/tau subunit
MKLSEVREIIRQVIAEAKEEKGSGLPKSGGKLVHLKKELDGLKKMKESLGQLQIAEGGEQQFVAEYAHMQKYVNELEKIKMAHAKLSEMLDNQINDVDGKIMSETNKIKELMGLIEKAPKEKKDAKKADKKDTPKAEKEEPKEEKEAPKKAAPKADDSKKKSKELKEAAFSSTDVNAILKAARAAVEAGKEVTVDGIKIGKVVPGLGRFIPADGSQSLKIMDYVGTPEKIVIDGVSAELKPMEPSKPQPDTRTPEEKAKAQAAFDDRYGPNGGYDTAFGRYTGD